MSRYLSFALLMASVVALAADKSKTGSADGATTTPKKTEAAHAATGSPHAKKEPAHRKAEQAPAKSEAEQQATKEPQAKTEDSQAQAENAQAKSNEGAKLTSVPDAKALGMSILGNQDAPKSLVIVPWKTSELGDSPGITPMLDDSMQPVDKEVFMRSLRYYEIRSKTKP
jgi:hypothetical protein